MKKYLKKILAKPLDFIKKQPVLWRPYLFLATLPVIARARRDFKKISYKTEHKSCKVIMYTVRTIPELSLTYFDSIFAHGFRKLGCDVKMMVCGGLLDSCDADTIVQDQESACYVCNRFRSAITSATGLEYIYFRDYITQEDIEKINNMVEKLGFNECNNYEYMGVNVGKHARAASIRFFLAGHLDENNPQHVNMLKQKLVYAMITAKIAENMYIKEKPDRIVMLHGVYSTWGPLVDFFYDKRVDIIIYAHMVTPYGSFMFTRQGREYELVARSTWESFRQIPITTEEEREIDAYLSARFKGKVGPRLIFDEHFKPATDKETILATLFKKQYSRRYIQYTNLAWDACLEGQGSSAFKDIFAWIDTTIEYFKNKPDYQLIVKSHPAELVWEKTKLGIADYLAEKYPDLPENISILQPDTSVTAYDLVFPGSICLTFNGTVGLELATQGVPVLAGGNAHYIDAGIVSKINTLEEYLGLLDDPSVLFNIAQKNQKLAKKYAYFYFLRIGIKLPFYRDDIWGNIDWRALENINEILKDNGTVLKICHRIIDSEDVVLPLG